MSHCTETPVFLELGLLPKTLHQQLVLNCHAFIMCCKVFYLFSINRQFAKNIGKQCTSIRGVHVLPDVKEVFIPPRCHCSCSFVCSWVKLNFAKLKSITLLRMIWNHGKLRYAHILLVVHVFVFWTGCKKISFIFEPGVWKYTGL